MHKWKFILMLNIATQNNSMDSMVLAVVFQVQISI